MQTQLPISLLLSSVGTSKETEQYLRDFATRARTTFAIVVVSQSLLRAEWDKVAAAMAVLHAVALPPVLLVTANGPSEGAAQALNEDCHELVTRLERFGANTRLVSHGVFEHGGALEARDALVRRALEAGSIPVVPGLGLQGGAFSPLDPWLCADALIRSLRPHKVVVLTKAGAVIDERGSTLFAINLEEDLPEVSAGLLHFDDGYYIPIPKVASTLFALPPTASISVTTPEKVLTELFTHKGAGTLIRKGERIVSLPDFSTLDTTRARTLLESSFGQVLEESYFTTQRPKGIFMTESYRAIAIVTEQCGTRYLDKIAVTPEAQGEGIAASLWRAVRKEAPRIFWRSRAHNPINSWYTKIAEGTLKESDFWIFWCGFVTLSEVEPCVRWALSQPRSFVARSP